jgi:hypothetical protein
MAEGLSPSAKGVASPAVSGGLAASEFCRGVTRNKSHYAELNCENQLNTLNRGCVSTVFMHYMQHVLDGYCMPVSLTEVGLLREIQIFMYVVIDELLKTDKWKSLVSA